MATQKPAPTTLMEAVRFFSDPDVCLAAAIQLRWGGGPVSCPTCGATDVHFIATRRIWRCSQQHERRQFSVKIGTVMEDSPIPLDKWLVAIWLLANAKNGISSYELHRAIGVTQKTAWFLLHRIRLAMQSQSFAKMSGEVELDETFIGGKARNMHHTKRERMGITQGKSMAGKVAVLGLLERHSAKGSQIRLAQIPNNKRRHLMPHIMQHVERGTTVHTDSLPSYTSLESDYTHNVIDHAEKYVDGQVHTNGLENFWSLLKRAIRGTYVSVEPFHLFRYLDEQCFRFNNRKLTDAERFAYAAATIVGKRLTYKELIGNCLSEPC
ncbi:MAG TPA: IS1595 family transposase [Vicinamibacterales bacterium]|jgi:transposase-like protein|nr:IS1595 family transposase [Vicinamibacterales bacterium]